MHACFEEKKLVINYISLVYGYFFWRSPQIRSCLLLRARPGSSPLLAFFWSSYLLSAAVSTLQSHERFPAFPNLISCQGPLKTLPGPMPAPRSNQLLFQAAGRFCDLILLISPVTPSCSLILSVSVPSLSCLVIAPVDRWIYLLRAPWARLFTRLTLWHPLSNWTKFNCIDFYLI